MVDFNSPKIAPNIYQSILHIVFVHTYSSKLLPQDEENIVEDIFLSVINNF